MKKNNILTALLISTVASSAFILNADAKTLSADEIIKLSEETVELSDGTKITSNRPLYVLGKHVIMDSYSLADVLDAAATSETVPFVMYYYNPDTDVWANNVDRTQTFVDTDTPAPGEVALPTFNIVKAINVTKAAVKEAEKEYGENGVDDEVDNKNIISLTFDDENDANKINDVTTVTPIELDGFASYSKEEMTKKHAINTGNITVSFDANTVEATPTTPAYDGTISIQENAPLTSYTNGSTINGKWIGLLIETEKSFKIATDSIKLYDYYNSGAYNYSVSVSDIDDYEVHGGIRNGLIIWIRGLDTTKDAALTFTSEDDAHNVVTKTYKLSYKAINNIYTLTTLSSDVEVTSDVYHETYLVADGKYETIFYNTTTTPIETVDYTVNGTIRRAVKVGEGYDDWYDYALIDEDASNLVIKGAAVDLNSDETDARNISAKWNQNSISVDAKKNTKTSTDTADYVVTVTKSRALESYTSNGGTGEWYSVIMNLNIDPTELTNYGLTPSTDAEKYAELNYGIESVDVIRAEVLRNAGVEVSETAFVMWLKADTLTRTIVFENANDSEDRVVVRFEIEEDYNNELSFSAKAATYVSLYGDTLDEDLAYDNIQYKKNMLAIDNDVTVSAGEDTDYVVTINAHDVFNNYKNGIAFYALIADVGISANGLYNYGLVSSDEEYSLYNYGIEEIDVTDATRHGATGNEFVMWLNANTKERTVYFKSKETHQVISVKIVVNSVELVPVFMGDASALTTAPTLNVEDGTVEYTSKHSDMFVVRDGVTSFTATKDEIEYLYKKTAGVWNCMQTLVLNDVKMGTILPEYDAKRILNATALKSMTVENNTVSVVFDRNLATIDANATHSGKYYAVLIDLGLIKENVVVATGETYTIEDIDKSEAYRQLGIASSENKNYIVLWLNENDTKGEGRTIKFANVIDPSVSLDITFKSTIDYTSDPADLGDNFTARVLDMTSFSDYNDDYKDEIISNNEGLTVSSSIVEDKYNVEVSYNKPFSSYNNGYMSQEWFGLILDLGVNPALLSVRDITNNVVYNIEDTDYSASSLIKFSNYSEVETGSTEFILWLRTEKFSSDKLVLEFTQKAESENAFDNALTVNFTLTDEIEPLNLTSVKMANYTTISDSNKINGYHETNQANVVVSKKNVGTTNYITYDVISDGTSAYTNSYAYGAWFAILVDFGVDPSNLVGTNYTIEEEDYTDAARHGGVGTEFVMWLRADKDINRTITFTNKYNSETYTFTIDGVVPVSNLDELNAALTLNGKVSIKLFNDISSDVVFTIPEDKEVELNLNGYTFSPLWIDIKENSTLTVNGEGNINTVWSMSVENGATLVSNDATYNVSNDYGIYIDGGYVEFNSGTINSLDSAFTSNNTTGDFNAVINGGTFNTTQGFAVYKPTPGTLTINGGVFNGGISFRMGTLNINGGEIYATTGDIDGYQDYYNYSGEAWFGDAIELLSGTYTVGANSTALNNDAIINITGGKIVSNNNHGTALNIQNMGVVSENVTVNISGGEFSTNNTSRSTFEIMNANSLTTSASYKANDNHVVVNITGGTGLTGVTESGDYFDTTTPYIDGTTSYTLS